MATHRPRTRLARSLIRARTSSPSPPSDGGEVRPALDPDLERALDRLVTAAERACDALGWLGWDARHAAEQQLREALDCVTRLRRTKRAR